jgi:beta-1,4-mannooligosaccharide phosphorylase
MKLFLLSLLFISSLSALPYDLEKECSDFVLETKKIEIPGYPHAFNPSIIRWHDYLLLSFRTIPDRKSSFNSELGLVWLDEEFNPISEPQLLDLRKNNRSVPCRAEDGRLIEVDGNLYMIYSDCSDPKISKGGFRVWIMQLDLDEDQFVAISSECFRNFEDASLMRREKNWTPFSYKNHLLLEYSQSPHRILFPLFGSNSCETVAFTENSLPWIWGELRGGTPALIDNGEYLSFFHSSIDMPSLHSEGKSIAHYFIGAYTFSSTPPFEMTKISPKPIIAKGFYSGPMHQPYWKPVRVVFPGGLLIEDESIYITYGKQDHEVWIAKLDKNALLKSLVPIY